MSCYMKQRSGTHKFASKCKHKDRENYSQGFCQECHGLLHSIDTPDYNRVKALVQKWNYECDIDEPIDWKQIAHFMPGWSPNQCHVMYDKINRVKERVYP